jgi:hypothetical protein
MKSKQGSRGAFEVENPQAVKLRMTPQDFPPRKEQGGLRGVSLSPSLPLSPSNKSYLRSTNLHLSYKFLTSLIIKLIESVDKSVDKLWISCGWSCG